MSKKKPYSTPEIKITGWSTIRKLSEIGIIALIDEATGYQEVRPKDELNNMLENKKI